MDFVIGRIPPPGSAAERRGRTEGQIEARILHVREPRRRRRGPGDGPERRRAAQETDPPGARVLVVLVPEAHRLPDDLAEGNYRLFLRFVRR
ncbi:MAG: hypothetical protein D6718_03740 [Acidobacteria bacterium]|nr:MAG: hypothetical protein D6718_03740 [Acidobacteriota bacterium]